MTIRIEDTNKDLDAILARNLAKGDWDSSAPSPALEAFLPTQSVTPMVKPLNKPGSPADIRARITDED